MKKRFQILLFLAILVIPLVYQLEAQSLYNEPDNSVPESSNVENSNPNSSIIQDKNDSNESLQQASRTLFLPKRSGRRLYTQTPAMLTSTYLQHRLEYILTLAASRKEHVLSWDQLIWRGTVSKIDISIIDKIYKYLFTNSEDFIQQRNSHNNLMTKKLGICGYYLLTKNELNGRYFNIPDQEYLDFYALIEKMTYNQFVTLLKEPNINMFRYQKLLFSFENIARESLKKDNKILVGSAYTVCEVVL